MIIYLHKKYDLPDGTQSKTVPIFPYEFSTDAGSLTTGEPKFARSYYFEIDKDGNVVNEVFYKSIITNSRATTFDEVNRTFFLYVFENGGNSAFFSHFPDKYFVAFLVEV